ncbi:MAG: MbnP family protein [Sphingobacterium sp.]
MKNIRKYVVLPLALITFLSCSKDNNDPVANAINLTFNNTFGEETIILGEAASSEATVNTSAEGQVHHFSEIKYVISNIRLIKSDGSEFPYHINDLDKGAVVVDQARPQTLDYPLKDIPKGEYNQIKFGLGVRSDLNTLDQVRFPDFYAQAGANDTEMMWEWGTGYRFVKLEGFYDTEDKQMSIHTGSTIEGQEGEFTQGVDAYRDVTLAFETPVSVGNTAPKIVIKADFDRLLSGKSNTIALQSGTGSDGNATPNVHSAVQMLKFVDNLGGDGERDLSGMFSVQAIEN